MTSRHILATDGVIGGDFHGDATMGFWGWPLEDPRRIESACRTALAIQQELTERAASSADPLAGFELGIGIAAGQVVAGQIGTAEQVKVTAFGPGGQSRGALRMTRVREDRS
ncbi:MAG: adenylate/guanylate cyclase domain-containing protein [Pirellulaceae bacterium]